MNTGKTRTSLDNIAALGAELDEGQLLQVSGGAKSQVIVIHGGHSHTSGDSN
ncbi:hypothetical protein Nocox_39915 [Nonomuraea coxensis DSM 45129]|uniref:Uncharacterized protein n=1 Tax=Nonomuraea coxensis DSM 45129 TaxID=1122611 RepID=A0ABX8UFJ3_9ACTN|nr:hypothetical protein [Nonomuraea coxensis]QYC45526.1 hypothetical protein Nocox_39915 [Nonomuraea coxensis DSM 45129]